MLIAGLEKCTLLDYPGKLAAIVFTHGCNMHCPYCHNPELVDTPISCLRVFSEKDVLGFLRRRVDKLDAVVITGGEPTLQGNLLEFIRKIKKMGFLVKLDSNGTNPDVLHKIMSENVIDYWAMDVKYTERIYGYALKHGPSYEQIRESISIIKSEALDYEFRTTVVRGIHDENSFHEIGKVIEGAKAYYLQNFRPGKTIDLSYGPERSFNREELESFKEIMEGYVEKVVIR